MSDVSVHKLLQQHIGIVMDLCFLYISTFSFIFHSLEFLTVVTMNQLFSILCRSVPRALASLMSIESQISANRLLTKAYTCLNILTPVNWLSISFLSAYPL